MQILNLIFGALAVLSFALLLWQWLAARQFPLHQRISNSTFAPAITLLKPLKGYDASTAQSLDSWFGQNYAGPIQILFGVADANDSVCKIVRELLKKYPHVDTQLVVCAEALGANAKVSTLVQLEKLAKHDLVLISDADVRVPPDFLTNAVMPFCNDVVGTSRRAGPAEVGLVNCFYRLANPTTAAMQWEAVAVNADFWSQVLQSKSLKPLDFALGAAMLTRRKILEEIGGFQSLANCLADDYQLGNRVAKKNYRIELSPVVVECWESPKNWREIWKHQLRWARTIRVCQPLPYFFSILSNATLWPLIWFCVSIATTKTFCMSLTAIAFILLRIVLAQNLQRRFTPDKKLVASFWLVPVKDLLQAVIWVFAFAGNTVEWRGKKMKLRRDGNLEW